MKKTGLLPIALFTAFFIFSANNIQAQDDLLNQLLEEQKPKKEAVRYTFKTTRVISGHSTEMVAKGALEFRVSHRFGDVAATNNDHIHSMFGFDQAADIGLLFDYGIKDNLTVGVARMKGAGPHRELWNTNIKYRALQQTTDFKIPFTLVLYGNAAMSSMRGINDETALNYFPKGYDGLAHRMSYTAQALLSIKAKEWLSLQLTNAFVWRNLVPDGDKNGIFFLGISGRAKFNKRSGMIFEYFIPVVKDGVGGRTPFAMVRGIKDAAYYPVLHIGYEFETGGHVFHINLTNSRGLLDQDFLPYNTSNWAQGQFRIGFTISRMFQLKQKEGKYWKEGSVED